MLDSEARLHAIAAHRWRVAFWLSGFMLVAYYGFILLVAFDKPFLAQRLGSGVTRRCSESAIKTAGAIGRRLYDPDEPFPASRAPPALGRDLRRSARAARTAAGSRPGSRAAPPPR